MALQCTPDKLREEIRAATTVRDKHLEHVDKLVQMFHGSYWRSDRIPPRAVVENHAYEFLSVMIPSVVYDDPRVKVRAADPHQTDLYGTTTMGMRAAQIQASLNRWSVNDELGSSLIDAMMDFYFAYHVLKVTMTDHPGWQGYENAPQKPMLVLLDPSHFVLDAAARSNDPMKLGGPRLMGEMWKADREDLMNDPMFDADQVEKLALDLDLDRYDPERSRGVDVPSRDEVVCWDIWVPEKDVRMDHDYQLRMMQMGMEPVPPDAPGYNGSIYTVAAHATGEGVSKKTYFIRPPEPAFCPPWGQYVMSGYMKVKNSPYPLSPLMATAEQAEEVNAHMVAAAEDARHYKKFGYYKNLNSPDGHRLKNVRHGSMIGLDETEGVGQMELGGVGDVQYRYNEFAQERLRRVSGLSGSVRGEPDEDATATAESIAAQGTQTRIEGIKSAFRRGVTRMFKTAAWYAHYSESFRMVVGEEGYAINGQPEYFGGISEEAGTVDFDFFDLTLELEPYSMGHTDQVTLQRRMEGAWQKLVEAAPIMAQTPYIRWDKAIKAFMEVLNIEDAEDWLDMGAMAMSQVIQAEQQMGVRGGAPMEPDPALEGGSDVPESNERPAMTQARSQGALQGAAVRAF